MAARWCCRSVSRPDHEPAVCWDRRLDSQRSAHSSTMRPSAARRSTKERGPAQGPTRSAARRSASCRRSTRIEKRLRWPFDSDERYLPSLLNPRSLSRPSRSEEHTSELQSLRHLVCRLLLEKKKKKKKKVQKIKNKKQQRNKKT